MKLHRLAPPKGAKKRAKTVGRGESSGHGKTSCRGGKGQTARTGGTIRPGFEGGQMPLYRRLPKFGFTSAKRVMGKNIYQVVSLGSLERFDEGATVDIDSLQRSGIVRKKDRMAGIKVLNSGSLSKKLHLKVNAISESAKGKVEALGGSIEIVKYTI